MKKNILFGAILALAFSACNNTGYKTNEHTAVKEEKEELRIVSLKGSFSEVIAGFGYTEKIVGTDVTSTYPLEVAQLSKVGHNRNISTEGVLALNPSLIVADPKEIKPETLEQLKSSNIELLLVEQEKSVEGTKNMFNQLNNYFKVNKELIDQLSNDIDQNINEVQAIENPPKVLFIYARGAGTLMVAGEGTQMQKMIELAGGKNAVSGFDDFKPLTSEALVAANPDVILMFSSGMESLDGMEGTLSIPGMKEVNAGKNKQIITMDGQYLAGFGPRVGQAVKELNQRFIEISQL